MLRAAAARPPAADPAACDMRPDAAAPAAAGMHGIFDVACSWTACAAVAGAAVAGAAGMRLAVGLGLRAEVLCVEVGVAAAGL